MPAKVSSRGEKESRTIMGIDPGTNYTGYGIVRTNGKNAECIVLGYIDLKKVSDTYEKLGKIFERVTGLIEQYRPDEVAFESPFFGENVQSMLKLGRAQGVAMAAAITQGLPVYEYAPRRIKQTITGSGASSKQHVAKILQSILKVEYTIKKLDATDGLAVALCHHYESFSPVKKTIREAKDKTKNKKTWENFILKNPHRNITEKINK